MNSKNIGNGILKQLFLLAICNNTDKYSQLNVHDDNYEQKQHFHVEILRTFKIWRLPTSKQLHWNFLASYFVRENSHLELQGMAKHLMPNDRQMDQ